MKYEESASWGTPKREYDPWDSWGNPKREYDPGASWSRDIIYWKIAEDMEACIYAIRNKDLGAEENLNAAFRLKNYLDWCVKEEDLSDLTSIYREKKRTIYWDMILIRFLNL